MGFFDTIDWETIKKDLQKGLEKGMAAMKRGAIVAKKRAGELTEEGKKQYQILTLKTKVHRGISDLGARVYALMGSRGKNPALDAKVKDMVTQIRRHEAQISALEKMPARSAGKKARKAA